MNAGNLTRAQRDRIDLAVTAVNLAATLHGSAVSAYLMAPGNPENARRVEDAGRSLGAALAALRLAWPMGESPGVTLPATLVAGVSGVLQIGGRVFPVTCPADAQSALRYAARGPGHDAPHWASGPRLGAPGPVHAVCVCRCPDCCGHRPGTLPARGEPGRCPGCSCYLAPGISDGPRTQEQARRNLGIAQIP